MVPSFNESDLIDGHYKLKKIHLDTIKNVDPKNQSNGLRIIIDEYLKHKRTLMFDKYLTSFAIGMILIGFGLTFVNLYIEIAMYITGGIMICYSLFMYLNGRLKYQREMKRYEMETRV